MHTLRASASLALFAVIVVAVLMSSASHPLAYAASGDLDLSFGSIGDGTAYVDFGGSWDEARAVALQPDGKILVAGTDATSLNTRDFAVARFCGNGKLDDGVNCGGPGFGSSGTVRTSINSDACGGSVVRAMGLQADGKIVVAGCGYPVAPTSGERTVALVRYLPSGLLDASFGSEGIAFGPLRDSQVAVSHAAALAIQPDGRLVVGGTACVLTNLPFPNASCLDFAVLRFTAAGSLDSTFGSGGHTFINIDGRDDEANALGLQPDGKLIVAGSTRDNTTSRFALVRLTATGNLDTGFGGTGIVTVSIGTMGDGANALAIQSDGRILAAGSTTFALSTTSFGLARFNADGSLDRSFGGDGTVTTTFSHLGTVPSNVLSLALQADGKIIAGGNANGAWALARYTSTGSLDTAFGQNGSVMKDFGSLLDSVAGIVLQPDGKIVAAGWDQAHFNESIWRVARFTNDPGTTPEPPQPAFQITNRPTAATVNVGQSVSWTVNTSFTSTLGVAAVGVYYNLPSNFTNASANGTSWTCDTLPTPLQGAATTLRCLWSTTPPGPTSATLPAITVRATAATCGQTSTTVVIATTSAQATMDVICVDEIPTCGPRLIVFVRGIVFTVVPEANQTMSSKAWGVTGQGFGELASHLVRNYGYRETDFRWFNYGGGSNSTISNGLYSGQDTRQIIATSAQHLDEQIERWSAACQGSRIDIIAHSLGGVVTAYWAGLNTPNRAKVRAALTIESPLGGAEEVLCFVRLGAEWANIAGDAGVNLCQNSVRQHIRTGLTRIPFLTMNNGRDPVVNGCIGKGVKRADGLVNGVLDGKVWDSFEFGLLAPCHISSLISIPAQLAPYIGRGIEAHTAPLSESCQCWNLVAKLMRSTVIDTTREPPLLSWTGDWVHKDRATHRIMGTESVGSGRDASVTFRPSSRPEKIVLITTMGPSSDAIRVSLCNLPPRLIPLKQGIGDARVEHPFVVPPDCAQPALHVQFLPSPGWLPGTVTIDAIEVWD